MNRLFSDRHDAGRRLAGQLGRFVDRSDAIVLSLPRGGVPVGYEVAKAIHAPLDVFLVRKLGTPGHEELAMGALASGGLRVMNRRVVEGLGISDAVIAAVVEREKRELARRETAYRRGRPPLEMSGRIVILVDDGLATGATMMAAADAVRQRGPEEVVVAVPVASQEAAAGLIGHADEVICLWTPHLFEAVGQFYLDFAQTTDEEVRELLEKAVGERLPQHA
jgi:predicted phosphoribosyltransferase